MDDNTSKIIEGVTTEATPRLKKKIQRRVAFKAMLLIVFIAFFFPLCTVSCSGQKVTSPNGYQAASNFGLSKDQLDTLEMTVEDVADPMIGIVIILMVCGLFITGTVANSVQAIVAFFIMIAFKHSERLIGLSNAGMQVEFKFGYYLALIAFLLAGTAFFWAPVIMDKKNQNINQFNAVNSLLTACLVIVSIIAVVTNTGMIKGIPASVYHGKDIGSLQNVESMLEDGAANWDGESMDSSAVVEDSTSAIESTAAINESKSQVISESDDYIFPDSDKRYLLDDEINSLTEDKTLIAFAEIYARKGAVFGGTEMEDSLQVYFNTKSWYSPERVLDEISDEEFNTFETYNLNELGNAYNKIVGSEDFVQYENSMEYYDVEPIEQEGDPGYGYIIEGSDFRYLTKDELSEMSKEELRLARNEIYARHGRIFNSADLNDYFSSMEWYYPTIPANQFDDSTILNQYEKANLTLIKEVETSR